MRRRIVIAGAGGFGREVHSWILTSPRFLSRERVERIVFIDDTAVPQAVPAPIVSGIRDYMSREEDLLICAIGSPAHRRTVVGALEERGGVFASFAHDSALIGLNVQTETGLVVCPQVIITTDVRIGAHVHINTKSTVGHDVVIGDFVTLSSACNLAGNVTVKDDAFLGTAVTVIPGKTVGAGSLVGAGSVVLRDVADGITSFGNPSKSYGQRKQ